MNNTATFNFDLNITIEDSGYGSMPYQISISLGDSPPITQAFEWEWACDPLPFVPQNDPPPVHRPILDNRPIHKPISDRIDWRKNGF